MTRRLPHFLVGLLFIAAGVLGITGADISDVWQWFAAGAAVAIGLAALLWATHSEDEHNAAHGDGGPLWRWLATGAAVVVLAGFVLSFAAGSDDEAWHDDDIQNFQDDQRQRDAELREDELQRQMDELQRQQEREQDELQRQMDELQRQQERDQEELRAEQDRIRAEAENPPDAPDTPDAPEAPDPPEADE